MVRQAQDIINGIDSQSFSVLFVRSVADNAAVSQQNHHWGEFIRGLAVNAGSIAETSHTAEYQRYQADTVQAAGLLFRHLFVFIRIMSKVFVRDYILGRFLIAREQIKLKSAIAREIILDSRID
jgi:hypothetical protein